jgi:LysR family cys regulon transcriptional activator
VVPRGHPLTSAGTLTLKMLAEFPIVTYEFSLFGRSSLSAQFEAAGLSLDVALTARDADVIKTYVRVGLGVGILAGVAFDPLNDDDLVPLDVSHLFEHQTTWIGFRRGSVLRAYMYDFIELLAPHLTRSRVRKAEQIKSPEALKRAVSALEIPLKGV